MVVETQESGNVSLRDLLDISAYQHLCDSFSKLFGIAISMLDPDGTVLVASGWQSICTEFHRKHPDTAARCLESDTVLSRGLAEQRSYKLYQCRNGLVDAAVPIVIGGMHVGNLFAGQFFLAPPDREFFAKQAEQLGFDRDSYLGALESVPVFPMEKVEDVLKYLVDLTAIVVTESLDKVKLMELNEELGKKVTERTLRLEESRERYRSLSEASFEGIVITRNGVVIEVNGAACRMFGYDEVEVVGKMVFSFVHPEDIEKLKKGLVLGHERLSDVRCIRKDGSVFPAEVQAKAFSYRGEEVRVSAIRDLSERRRAEEEIRRLRDILPICAFCKKIRDDQGYWEQVEVYVRDHYEADFSHGICPECMKKHYPDVDMAELGE